MDAVWQKLGSRDYVMMDNPSDDVDDPGDSFEYDEHGCLVQFTPEAFDYFMLANANSARVAEVLRRLQGSRDHFQAASDDPYVEGQMDSIRQLLASSEVRLRTPITQLALMRLSLKCQSAIQRFNDERMQERRASVWLQF